MHDDLDQFTARVLRLVCESSPVGAVRLADYIWPLDVPPNWIIVLEEALKELGERGYVYYTLGWSASAGRYNEHFGITRGSAWINVARATGAGLAAAGFPERLHLVGTGRLTHFRQPTIPATPGHRFDGTIYWRHEAVAQGVGPIEREPLWLHRRRFPDHLHDTDFDVQEGVTIMATPVTQEQIAEIRRLKDQGLTVTEISSRVGRSVSVISTYTGALHPRAQEIIDLLAQGMKQGQVGSQLGLPQASVSRIAIGGRLAGLVPTSIMVALPPDRDDDGPSQAPVTPEATLADYGQRVGVSIPVESLGDLSSDIDPYVVAGQIAAAGIHSRILKALAANGPYLDTNALMKAVRNGTALHGHEVQHNLQSLEKQGLVKFTVRRVGSRKTMTKIDITPAGLREVGITRPKPPVPQVRPGDLTNPTNHGLRARGGKIERSKVLDVHEHDADVWRLDCAACKVYHPDGESHVVAEAMKQAATNAEILNERFEFPAGPPMVVAWGDGEPPEAIVVATDAGDGWPILDALKDRVIVNVAAARSSARYLEAAALLEGINDQERDHLLELAEAAEGEPFSLIESEYLRFAEVHHG